MNDAFSILVVAVFSAAFLALLYDAIRKPARYEGVFNDLRGWVRAKRLLLVLTVAAVTALVVADASEYTVGIVAVIGFCLAAVSNQFVIWARHNERMRRFFGR